MTCLCGQVFVTPRASIPDVYPNAALPPQQQLLMFDSLKSMPTQLPEHLTQQQQQSAAAQQAMELPMPAVEAVAAFLRSHLGLNLFGFDVVIPQGAADEGGSKLTPGSNTQQPQQQSSETKQELVVIDVNYFPNYRGGTDTAALFRATLRQCWEQHQQKQLDSKGLPVTG